MTPGPYWNKTSMLTHGTRCWVEGFYWGVGTTCVGIGIGLLIYYFL